MEIKSLYLQAIQQKAPALYRELCRNHMMIDRLNQISAEAHTMLAQILAQEPKDRHGNPINPAAEREAEERVRAILLEFPEPEHQKGPGNLAGPEPPDDLPTRMSQVKTT
jgi:hypothetical protein